MVERENMNLILLGGGLDSITLMVKLRKDFPQSPLTALHVDYGQKAIDGERVACRYFCKKYSVELFEGSMDLSLFSGAAILQHTPMGSTRKSNCLEMRNVALVSYASVLVASYDGVGGLIYLGFHKELDNTFMDATTDWLDPMSKALHLASMVTVGIRTPFDNMTREDIILVAKETDSEILTKSYTCYEAPDEQGRECGKCIHCIKKKQMLEGL